MGYLYGVIAGLTLLVANIWYIGSLKSEIKDKIITITSLEGNLSTLGANKVRVEQERDMCNSALDSQNTTIKNMANEYEVLLGKYQSKPKVLVKVIKEASNDCKDVADQLNDIRSIDLNRL